MPLGVDVDNPTYCPHCGEGWDCCRTGILIRQGWVQPPPKPQIRGRDGDDDGRPICCGRTMIAAQGRHWCESCGRWETR